MDFSPAPALIDGGELPDVAALPLADGGDWSLESLLDVEPGPMAIAILSSIDPAGLDEAGRLAVMAAWERQASWVAAKSHAATVAVAGRKSVDDDDFARDDVAAALRVSGRAAQGRIELARMLATRLPGTLALLEDGLLSTHHAWAMTDVCAQLPEDACAAVEARVLPAAPGQTVGALRRSALRAIGALFPARAEQAFELAGGERDVVMVAEPDGMAKVIATLTAPEARALFLAVDALARGRHQAEGGRNSGVGIGARRADALVALADAALASRALPRAQGRPVELQVLIELPTLLRSADNPAELVGYGPIPAEVARELAADAAWRRLIVDPVDGHLLDFGAAVYRPPQKLADYVAARDRRCRFPGCGMRAAACDLDHVIPWGKPGGITTASNLLALCRRHHRLKTHRGWRLELHKNGAVSWLAPGGRRYDLDAHRQLDIPRRQLDLSRPPSAPGRQRGSP